MIGVPPAIQLGGVGGCSALVCSGLIIAGMKLNEKLKQHQEIGTLADGGE